MCRPQTCTSWRSDWRTERVRGNPRSDSNRHRERHLQPQGGSGGRADNAVHLEAGGASLELLHRGLGFRAEVAVDDQLPGVVVVGILEPGLELGDLWSLGAAEDKTSAYCPTGTGGLGVGAGLAMLPMRA